MADAVPMESNRTDIGNKKSPYRRPLNRLRINMKMDLFRQRPIDIW